jgi:HEAT repeat protein
MARTGALAVAVLLAHAATNLARAEESVPKPPAAAKGRAKGKGKRAGADVAVSKRFALPGERLEALRLTLAGPDDAGAIEAATALGTSGASNASEPLVEALATGCSPGRTEAALDALGKLAEAGALATAGDRALEVLELYAGHRAPDLRRRALKALGALRDPRLAAATTPLLVARLGDAAPEVRAAAGEALATRHETKASPRLFALLKRGDAGAAAPLAALATPDMVPQIAELAGTVDDALLATALGEYVKRDDVPDKLRVDVLRTIGGLGGADATTALVEYIASVPAKDNRPSKREAQKLLDQRGSAKP